MKKIRVWTGAVAVALAATLVTAGAQSNTTAADPAAQGLRRYSGTPIDVDYQAANLRTVLRNLAEIGA